MNITIKLILQRYINDAREYLAKATESYYSYLGLAQKYHLEYGICYYVMVKYTVQTTVKERNTKLIVAKTEEYVKLFAQVDKHGYIAECIQYNDYQGREALYKRIELAEKIISFINSEQNAIMNVNPNKT